MVKRAWQSMKKGARTAALYVTMGGLALGSLGLGACSSDDESPPPDPMALSPQAVFVRASLDVRGIRPSAAELAALQQAPDQLDVMVAALVDDPRFGNRVRAIFAPAVRTRRDEFLFLAGELGLEEEQAIPLHQGLTEETLNIMHYVAVSDKPFTEILTADYTVIHPLMYQLWPLEAVESQPGELPAGTEMARYTDGRPSAGILSTNSFYWRHTSTVENANRGRTNAISRAFLCEDYLERPIDFPTDVDLTDSEGIREAIKTNAGCQACHATLDPFASHLWGFMQLTDDLYSWRLYHPENEQMWQQQTEALPAYFGKPTSGTLGGLAQAIAGDERFVACTTRRIYEGLMGRPAALADEGQLAFHREAFLASGLSLKALVRSVLTDPAYRGLARLSSYGGTPAPVELKLVSPEQLSSSIAELSGYRLSYLGLDMTALDLGVRALAGGSERGPSATPSLGRALVHRRLAEGAAQALAGNDTPGSRIGALLGGIDLSARPAPELVAQLLYEVQSEQVAADAEQVQALLALWDEVAAAETGPDAWAAMLTATLSDPMLAVY